jgi:hypothetical protein
MRVCFCFLSVRLGKGRQAEYFRRAEWNYSTHHRAISRCRKGSKGESRGERVRDIEACDGFWGVWERVWEIDSTVVYS